MKRGTTAKCGIGAVTIGLTVSCILTVLLVNGYYVSTPNIGKDRVISVVSARGEQGAKERLKTILLWNPLYKLPLYGLSSSGRKPFLDAQCPVSHCAVTKDRTALDHASAVVFHKVGDAKNQLPTHRPEDQLYIHYLWESPANHLMTYIDDVMNITVTYRRDSDVFRPYQYPVKLDKRQQYAFKFPIENRTKSVVGMISNCHTVGGRERYIEELRKHIDVDIWGECGEYKCSKNEKNRCTQELAKTYHFYLSFENSFCVDYVTEKLQRPLLNDLIPLVLGGTNYTRDAPPHSVINVLDYKSPAHLARYLRYLLNNKPAYMEYFKWKQAHKMVNVDMTQVFCKLCEILHNDTFSKRYVNFKKWWNDDTCNNNIIDAYLVHSSN